MAQAQVAKDFRQMQVVNNEMMSAAMTAREPDYSNIADSTSVIRECASRLKSNLALAKVGKEPAKEKRRSASSAEEMKADLLSLDRFIASFVHNPVFVRLEVLNVEHAMKARSDLEAIVELSRSISRDAHRLNKSAKKPSP
jgi:hypothetical protein